MVNELIEELFLYSKLDVNGVTFELERVHIIDYLKDCYEELYLDAEERGITLALEEKKLSNPWVIADRGRLQRAWLSNFKEDC